MTEVIDSVTPTRKPFPWSKWADGKPRRAVRGRDFESETDRFRNTVYQAARRMGLKAKVAVKGNAVEFQFVKPGKVKTKAARLIKSTVSTRKPKRAKSAK